jgi:hypothetical protein
VSPAGFRPLDGAEVGRDRLSKRDIAAAGGKPGPGAIAITALAAFAGANTAGVRSPYAVRAARLSPDELPAAAAAVRPLR